MDPFLQIKPGVIPIFDSSAVIMPGQFGPISMLEDLLSIFFTSIISLTGIPSEIHTINLIFSSMASIIASAANFGGTKIVVA